MSAFRLGQCASILAVAAAYNVSKATLARRLNGGTAREDFTIANRRLTVIEEEVLVRDILKLDTQGLLLTISLIRVIADIIYRVRNTPPIRLN
jgi:hypothetical protein